MSTDSCQSDGVPLEDLSKLHLQRQGNVQYLSRPLRGMVLVLHRSLKTHFGSYRGTDVYRHQKHLSFLIVHFYTSQELFPRLYQS